ncbi:unnamed protein product [Brassica oleracea]
MKVKFFILLLIISWLSKKITSLPPESRVVDRRSFPDNFVFGTAASAFQYEGATSEGGKSPSIWDYFSHTFPERTNMQNGDVAVDFYHRYKDDIKLMKELDMDAFRFSISWARLIPSGKVKDGVNKEGVKFYNALIDELIANGKLIQTQNIYVQAFNLLCPSIIGIILKLSRMKDFRDFSRVCFEEFGDRVKMWTTINEPYIITVAGYDTGNKAVGRCSKWVNSQCQAGDSATEPYIASHHLLLAHAAAVQEFRKCNKVHIQKLLFGNIYSHGQIGIVLSPLWFEPYDSTSLEDNEAVKRALVIELDWHLDPVIHGDYPEILKKQLRNRLPSFTAEQSKMLKNSSDFIGVNYYTGRYIAHLPYIDPARPRFKTDQQLEWRGNSKNINVLSFVTQEDRGILHSVPEGLRKVLNYIKDKYSNPTVYIKENGINDYDDGTKSREDILNDTFRIKYHKDHLQQLHKAIMEDGCDVRGYYAWSLLDNFEWEHGYNTRFGLYYVDYDNNLERYPKDSVNWFKRFLNRLDVKSEIKKEDVWDVSRNNKTLDDDAKGFEASVRTIIYHMTNSSRREEEEEKDRCTLEVPYNRLDLSLGSYTSFGL